MKFRKQHPRHIKIYHSYNPFLSGNSEELTKILMNLMPVRPDYTPEKELHFAKIRKEREDKYNEDRYGELPPNTYRILDQGGFCGWTYELELENKIILLEEPGEPNSSFRVHSSNSKRALELAKGHVARLYGLDAANNAKFVVVFGGKL